MQTILKKQAWVKQFLLKYFFQSLYDLGAECLFATQRLHTKNEQKEWNNWESQRPEQGTS